MKSVMFSKIIEILASIFKKKSPGKRQEKVGSRVGVSNSLPTEGKTFFFSSFSGVIKEAVTMDGLCCIEIKKTRGRQNRRKEPKSHLSSM